MASVHEYKRFENSLVQTIKNITIVIAGGAGGFFKGFFRILTRRYTVVLVPHSERKVYNLHITIFSFCCFLLVIGGLVGAFFWYGASYTSTQAMLTSKDGRLKDVQANLDQLRDEVTGLLQEARGFETTLTEILAGLGADVKQPGDARSSSGDLSVFFNIQETPEGLLQEVDDVRRLSAYLASAQTPIREIGTLLDSQSALLTEIPSIWP
ncbi:MAG: M23 family peptidase, partial [Treponema sp.]|nr:M23 family peptidase [Treponema sp.]